MAVVYTVTSACHTCRGSFGDLVRTRSCSVVGRRTGGVFVGGLSVIRASIDCPESRRDEYMRTRDRKKYDGQRQTEENHQRDKNNIYFSFFLELETHTNEGGRHKQCMRPPFRIGNNSMQGWGVTGIA